MKIINRKPFNIYFLFIFFMTHLNPRIIHSLRTKGDITTHPNATKNLSPIGYFILFSFYLVNLLFLAILLFFLV